ncbi:MAG TPA: hypothetical protein VLQ68_08485 [Rhizobiaceae bacterium]|nr:hypothetical protein [Rhizobiaceae bacterium]
MKQHQEHGGKADEETAKGSGKGREFRHGMILSIVNPTLLHSALRQRGERKVFAENFGIVALQFN